jgi:hypothetical protein
MMMNSEHGKLRIVGWVLVASVPALLCAGVVRAGQPAASPAEPDATPFLRLTQIDYSIPGVLEVTSAPDAIEGLAEDELDEDIFMLAGPGGSADLYDISPCGGDGQVEVGDILAMLAAYSGNYACACPAATAWGLTGNAGTNPATNYIGTPDNVAVNFRVQGQRALRLEPNSTVAPNIIGGYAGNYVAPGLYGASIGGGGNGGGGENVVASEWGTIGGGVGNVTGGSDFCGAGGNIGQYCSSNDDCPGSYCQNSQMATVGGGWGNYAEAHQSTVSGGRNNRTRSLTSTISGGSGNRIGTGDTRIEDSDGSAIAGGINNAARGKQSFVGGGFAHQVHDDYGSIGGGRQNIAGSNNGVLVDSPAATVSGGRENAATAAYSTVPGGHLNAAAGSYSLAAGRRAKANHGGAFVWGDSTDADFASTGANQFLIRTDGGVGINTNNPGSHDLAIVGSASLTAGSTLYAENTNGIGVAAHLLTSSTASTLMVQNNSSGGDLIQGYAAGGALPVFQLRSSGRLGINRFSAPDHPVHIGSSATTGNGAHLTGGGTWTNGSSREFKENFEAIDKREVLRKVVELPVTRWQYRGEDEFTRHIGPVAEDFRAAFGLGHDERYITTIDADGVALAAIQGLHEIVREKDCEIDELRTRNAELEARMARIERMLSTAGGQNPP